MNQVWGVEATGFPLNGKLLNWMTNFQLLHASKGYEIRFAEKHKLGSPGKISHESIILLNILIYTS